MYIYIYFFSRSTKPSIQKRTNMYLVYDITTSPTLPWKRLWTRRKTISKGSPTLLRELWGWNCPPTTSPKLPPYEERKEAPPYMG